LIIYKSLLYFSRGTKKISAGWKVGGIELDKKYITVQNLEKFCPRYSSNLVLERGKLFVASDHPSADQSGDAANFLL